MIWRAVSVAQIHLAEPSRNRPQVQPAEEPHGTRNVRSGRTLTRHDTLRHAQCYLSNHHGLLFRFRLCECACETFSGPGTRLELIGRARLRTVVSSSHPVVTSAFDHGRRSPGRFPAFSSSTAVQVAAPTARLVPFFLYILRQIGTVT